MSVVALVGNPREGSRTLTVAVEAARAIGRRLGQAGHEPSQGPSKGFSREPGRGAGGAEPYEVVDLAALGPHLLAPGASPQVEVALELVREASVLVVASPTYKGTYTGLLKAFLDRLPPQALAGKAALPLLVMGDARHALAVEVHLRPLLVELGATVPTPGLAVLESQLPSLEEVITPWADRVAPQAAAGAGLTQVAEAGASQAGAEASQAAGAGASQAAGGGGAAPAVVTSGVTSS